MDVSELAEAERTNADETKEWVLTSPCFKLKPGVENDGRGCEGLCGIPLPLAKAFERRASYFRETVDE